MVTTDAWVTWVQDQRVGTSVCPDEYGVCRTCWAPTRKGSAGTPYAQCWDCRTHFADVLVAAIPISYSIPDDLMSMIWQAKNSPGMQWLRIPLVSILYNFLNQHLSCIEQFAGGAIDAITVVPSHPSRRNGDDHLKQLHGVVKYWPQNWELDILQKQAPTTADTRRKLIVPNLFTVASGAEVTNRRILLIDDLFTSGGTIASAASALTAAGAFKPVALTIGRHLSTDRPEVVELLDRHRDQSLDLTICAVHQVWRPWS